MTMLSANKWGRALKLAATPILLASLAACAATPFRSDVTRFQSQLPAPQGETFAVVSDDPALQGGLEFSQYAQFVSDQMQRLGHGPVHLTARDERHGVEVFLWFDELELDAFFFKPSLLLSHEEWDVIGVEEPLQTECDFVRHEDVPFSRSR